MTEFSDRFSSVADYYARYRPDYPIQVIWFLKKNLLLDRDFAVADIGSGTGLSSMLFLPHVRKVYAVEPNDNMREHSRKLLSQQDNFIAIKGTAENTTLGDKSIDMAVVAQTFHWLDPDAARNEFKRFLKQNAPVVILWNDSDYSSNSFMRAYEDFLKIYSKPMPRDRRSSANQPALDKFYENGYEHTSFHHEQHLDWDGVKGRYLSSSYAFGSDHPRHEECMDALYNIFSRYEYGGKVVFTYKTAVFYGLLNKRHIALWKKVVFHLLRIPAFFAYIFLLTGMFFNSLFYKLKRKLSQKG